MFTGYREPRASCPCHACHGRLAQVLRRLAVLRFGTTPMKTRFYLPQAICLALVAWFISPSRAAFAAGPTTTLSEPNSPFKSPDAEGFLQRWLILEPIATTGLTKSAVKDAVGERAFSGSICAGSAGWAEGNHQRPGVAWHAEDTNRSTWTSTTLPTPTTSRVPTSYSGR